MNKKLVIVVAAFVVIFGGYFGAKQYAISIAKEKIDAAIAKENHLMAVTYKDVDVNLFSKAVFISDVTMQSIGDAQKIEMSEMAILKFDTDHVIPRFVELELRGVKTDVAERGAYSKILQSLGYSNLTSDMSLSYHFDPEKKSLVVNKFGVSIADVAEISASLSMGNVVTGDTPSKVNMANLLQVSFTRGSLIYRDLAITKKLFEAVAKKRQTTVKEFKKTAAQELQMLADASSNPLEKQAYAAFIAFVKNPNKLELTANPKKPVPMIQLFLNREPMKLIPILGISITGG